MNFEDALREIKEDTRVGMRLPSWSPDTLVKAHYPSMDSRITAPYLLMVNRYGATPWIPLNLELFNNKWEVTE